ncbi:MAG: NAD(P)/FAD-dependent oxidoreductase [Deltaproteobacteria bacterium]|jgi:thioredoxin reductase (NADPH)|nr:NAD(P)/FAD-dependent oxidoreductase [Deltaproteobacteria bacterium]MBW2535141.1 NAD(P)/FAD-dependent oxidoreductase [Deltaproteobacteria bacterium]
MTPQRPRVLIIGGGPGGIACGIWAARLGLQAWLLEASDSLGGQLRTVLSPVTDYPGIPGVDGPGLAARFVEHLRQTDVTLRLGCSIASVQEQPPKVTTTDGEALEGDAIIVATGARRRRLGLDREAALVGHGISYSVSKDRGRAAGRAAVIVGGGDSAAEGAASLAEVCPAVHLVYRDELSARPDFVAAARAARAVCAHPGRRVTELYGSTELEGVGLDDGTKLECSSLFIRIGVEPCTELLQSLLPCDERGFLRVDDQQRCRGAIYAVGDVCSPDRMAVSVAVGQAMVACKAIQQSWRRA